MYLGIYCIALPVIYRYLPSSLLRYVGTREEGDRRGEETVGGRVEIRCCSIYSGAYMNL